jgi:hypothetical protein
MSDFQRGIDEALRIWGCSEGPRPPQDGQNDVPLILTSIKRTLANMEARVRIAPPTGSYPLDLRDLTSSRNVWNCTDVRSSASRNVGSHDDVPKRRLYVAAESTSTDILRMTKPASYFTRGDSLFFEAGLPHTDVQRTIRMAGQVVTVA